MPCVGRRRSLSLIPDDARRRALAGRFDPISHASSRRRCLGDAPAFHVANGNRFETSNTAGAAKHNLPRLRETLGNRGA